MSNQKVNIRSYALWLELKNSMILRILYYEKNFHGWVCDKCHSHNILAPHNTNIFRAIPYQQGIHVISVSFL
jgi:hypothetical protein